MARPLRITFPGAFYHVTSRGNERKNIFKSKRYKASTAQKGYQEFVNALVNRKYDNPLDDVVGSTLLGSSDFIAFIKDKFLSGKKLDKELPPLKELVPKTSMQDIFDEVESVFRKERASVSDIVGKIKANTSRMVRKKFEFIKEIYWRNEFWSPGFFHRQLV